MMGIWGPKTKKDLRAMVGRPAAFRETSVFGPEYHGDGRYGVVGPDPYLSRKWYAQVDVASGLIVGVR